MFSSAPQSYYYCNMIMSKTIDHTVSKFVDRKR